MGVACLGSGGGHRKAHEDARNQQQSSFHGNNAHGRFSAKPCLMCSKPIDVAIEQQHPLPDAKARQRLLRFELLEVSALTTALGPRLAPQVLVREGQLCEQVDFGNHGVASVHADNVYGDHVGRERCRSLHIDSEAARRPKYAANWAA